MARETAVVEEEDLKLAIYSLDSEAMAMMYSTHS